MITKTIGIDVQISEKTLDKFLLYYPDQEAIADELLRQIYASDALRTGKPVKIKWVPYKRGGYK